MVDLIELAIYGERLVVGGVEMVPDEEGNLYSLEAIEERLRGMIPGGNLVKRIIPRKTPVQIAATPEFKITPVEAPAMQLQPGTFQRPVLENPYAKTASP